MFDPLKVLERYTALYRGFELVSIVLQYDQRRGKIYFRGENVTRYIYGHTRIPFPLGSEHLTLIAVLQNYVDDYLESFLRRRPRPPIDELPVLSPRNYHSLLANSYAAATPVPQTIREWRLQRSRTPYASRVEGLRSLPTPKPAKRRRPSWESRRLARARPQPPISRVPVKRALRKGKRSRSP
jgi:hypothetical protein